jgi:hypothetical protein
MLITDSLVKNIEKKITKGNKTATRYVVLVIAIYSAVIVSLHASISDLFQLKTFLAVTKGYFIIFTPFSLTYLCFNALRKLTSIISLQQAIVCIKAGSWEWVNIGNFNSPSTMHPSVISHPVSIYLFGNLFIKNGFVAEGNQLVNIATARANELKKISVTSNLTDEDAQLLQYLVDRDKNFRTMLAIKRLWER